MPEPVEAAVGAEQVDFPWFRATEAVGALNAAASTLTGQVEARERLHDVLTEWTGGYRDEFDLAYDDVMTEGTSLQEALLLRAGAIADAAIAANELQTAYNNRPVATHPFE